MALDDIMEIEAKIITTVVDRILEHPACYIAVRDEEAVACMTTRDRGEILEAVGQTAYTQLVVYHRTGGKAFVMERWGTIHFIHGNGSDVLSDYSYDSAYNEAGAFMAKVCETVE